MRSIYWFKRDLRIEDNRALTKCFEESREVYPIFIFDKNLLSFLNSFDNRLYFLKLILENLKKKINLTIFYGETKEIFEYLIKKLRPTAIYTCESLTWEGEERNFQIKKLANSYGVKFIEVFENFLVDVRKIPYTKIYSHFFKKWIKLVDESCCILRGNLLKKAKLLITNPFQLPKSLEKLRPSLNFYWTIDFLKNRLRKFDFESYHLKRDYLFEDGTSKLSPYIRFGVISLRALYKKVKEKSQIFIKELAWREFWYHLKHYFPEMKSLELRKEKRKIIWENNEKYIEAFMNGKTGYPIVDAGIFQLKTENWMHNRARMIAASFLTKDLLVDWRVGERFFSKYLIDYDEVVNVGNWQWIASVGADTRFQRIFNPILQSKKFDPYCIYIKKYIPEVRNISCEKLHNPLFFALKYSPPIVNHYHRIKLLKQFWN